MTGGDRDRGERQRERARDSQGNRKRMTGGGAEIGKRDRKNGQGTVRGRGRDLGQRNGREKGESGNTSDRWAKGL